MDKFDLRFESAEFILVIMKCMTILWRNEKSNLTRKSVCYQKKLLQLFLSLFRSFLPNIAFTYLRNLQKEALKPSAPISTQFSCLNFEYFCRLGRLPSVSVDWSEVNTAWGQTVLLLHSLCRKINLTLNKYQLVPYGNFSYIKVWWSYFLWHFWWLVKI